MNDPIREEGFFVLQQTVSNNGELKFHKTQEDAEADAKRLLIGNMHVYVFSGVRFTTSQIQKRHGCD